MSSGIRGSGLEPLHAVGSGDQQFILRVQPKLVGILDVLDRLNTTFALRNTALEGRDRRNDPAVLDLPENDRPILRRSPA